MGDGSGYLFCCKLLMIVGKWSSLELMCSGRWSVLPILCIIVQWGRWRGKQDCENFCSAISLLLPCFLSLWVDVD